MEFIRNFPFFSIIICMFSGIISSVLNGKKARNLCFGAVSLVGVLSACVLFYTLQTGTSFTYMMGHYPAPWGNEIRAGVLEGLLATVFSVVLLLSLVSAYHRTAEDIEDTKLNLFYLLVDLLLSSLLAIIYTNDLFTAYVFVEINTIAACGVTRPIFLAKGVKRFEFEFDKTVILIPFWRINSSHSGRPSVKTCP